MQSNESLKTQFSRSMQEFLVVNCEEKDFIRIFQSFFFYSLIIVAGMRRKYFESRNSCDIYITRTQWEKGLHKKQNMDEENSTENREKEGKREEDPEPEPGKRFFKYHHLREGETKKKPGRMWTNTTKIITKRSLHPATQKVMIMYQLVGNTHSQQFTPLFSERQPRREGIPEESQSSHSSDSSSSTD